MMEEARGFIRDMLDVKMLILFVMAEAKYAMTMQAIYEATFQYDKLSYFDIAIAVPQMVETGHLQEVEHGKFRLTALGRDAEENTWDGIPKPVLDRARAAVIRFNRKTRREQMIHADYSRREGEREEYAVRLDLGDEIGELMHLELTAGSEQQAEQLKKAFEEGAELLYRNIMEQLSVRKENADV